jgi:hypothetical protein
MELLSFLLDPKFLSIVGPLGVMAVVEGYCIYKLFKLYSDLQEARLREWKSMVDEYNHLAKDINSTLDLLIKLSGKSNGTGAK